MDVVGCNMVRNKGEVFVVKQRRFYLLILYLTALCPFLSACGEDRSTPVVEYREDDPISDAENETMDSGIADFSSELYFASMRDMHEAYGIKWKEKLLNEGRISAEDEVYSSIFYWNESQPIYEQVEAGSECFSSFCFFRIADTGIPTMYQSNVTWTLQDNRICVLNEEQWDGDLLLSVDYGKEYVCEEYSSSFIGFDGIFSRTFEELLEYQNDSAKESLLQLMEANGMTGDRGIFDLICAKRTSTDCFIHPDTAIKELLPVLKDCDMEYIKGSETSGTLLIRSGNGIEYKAGVTVLGKDELGQQLYGPFIANLYSEEHQQSMDRLTSVSASELVTMVQYTYSDIWNGSVDTDFFLVAEIEGEDIALYGMTDFSGYVLRVGESVYPVCYFVDSNPPGYFVADDFDHDGNEEYGFTVCTGRGTGCYMETLCIVDPDKENKVSTFSMDDLRTFHGDYFQGFHSEHDHNCQGLGFGDFLYISYESGKWQFSALGGCMWSDRAQPDYDQAVSLCGEIIYENQKYDVENLQLVQTEE